MSYMKMTPVLATLAPSKTVVTDGRHDSAAASAGGTTRTQTATTVIRWISSKHHNLTKVCKCGIMPMIIFGALLREPLWFKR